MPEGTGNYRPWAPQPGPQLAAIEAHWCPELFFGGARGGGKSDYLLGDYLMDAGGEYGPEWRGIIFRRTYPELEEIIARSKVIIPSTFPGAEWTEQPKTWTLPSGATLRMRYMERDDDASRYQGHQYTWIGFDELTNWPSPAGYLQIMATLRNGAMRIDNKRIRSSGNPGGPGHQWVKARFVDPAPSGYEPIEDPKTGMVRMFIPSKVVDNQVLLINDPGYIARLQGVGSQDLVRAWLDGDWSVITGAFFDCWSNERHVIRPIELPDHWARFCSIDWGFARPFAVYWFAVSDGELPQFPKGALVVYREWYGASEPNVGLRLTAEQVAEGIVSREREKIAYRVCDPAMKQEDGGPSIAERMYRHSETLWRPGDNKRQPGWDQVRARLVGEDGKPMLYVFSTCAHLIRTLPALQHDEAKPEDLDTDGEDHAADALRYGLMSRPYVRPKPKAAEPIKTLDKMTYRDVEKWVLRPQKERIR